MSCCLKGQPQTVEFLISISGPFDKIPLQLFNGIEEKDHVLLKLVYHSPQVTTKAIDSLCVNARLNRAFGNGLQFPSLAGSSNVARYVTELKEFLVERIDMLDNGLSKRKGYINSFTSAFEGGLIEFDATNYKTATALINYLDFHFILQVTMPTYFPKEQPKLTFRSVYHTDELDRPFNKSVKIYPWSPRWSSDEMIKRLQSFVAEIIPTFQKSSVLQGTALKAAEEHIPEYEDGYNNLSQ